MINAQRIVALAKQPSPRGTGTDQIDGAGIIRALSSLHCEPDQAAQPVPWSSGLCAIQPLETAGDGALIAAEDAVRVCTVCPIRNSCHAAFLPGAPIEVQRWRERVDGGGRPLAQ
ncbi:hypothetical protein [Streptomyces regalis]|uniref:Uncharacterized protein n=1 Tax=Streptomyces regalis TaxID=68262 RepID=A0A117ML85_9ACTN|nr:hypothetical protein [Streptomyces regalis]KUL23306.1 hypothetical protein ADL12_40290 [Streptomyces regalis]